MPDNPLHPAGAQDPGQGLRVPEKFRDPATGQINVDALLRSYVELERRMSQMIELPGPQSAPAARASFHCSLGVPARPEDYDIRCDHPLIEPDAEVNKRLHAAGFTPAQAQLVYDLAGERMIPAIEDLAGDFQAQAQLERLVRYFGGEEKWTDVARSLSAWGRQNLPPEVFATLSTTSEGVMTLFKMMNSGEPGLLRDGESPPMVGEDELKRMMADPRYWRERDPSFVAQVSDGFKRLYPNRPGG